MKKTSGMFLCMQVEKKNLSVIMALRPPDNSLKNKQKEEEKKEIPQRSEKRNELR